MVTLEEQVAVESTVVAPTNPNLSRRIYAADRDKIDELAGEGLYPKEIADRTGFTKEGIRQYLVREGMQEMQRVSIKRRERKAQKRKLKARKQQESALEQLTSTLGKVIANRLQGESEAFQDAFEYTSRPGVRTEFKNLHTILRRYDKAERNGIKLSLEKLGEGITSDLTGIGKLLRLTNREPMFGTLDVHVTTTEQKEAMDRGYHIPMSAIDISYFIGIHSRVVSMRYLREGKLRKGKRPKPKKLPLRLTYKKLSQIYQKQDDGRDVGVIAQSLDFNMKQVTHAIEQRHVYEPIMVHAIQALHPSRNIETPYLS